MRRITLSGQSGVRCFKQIWKVVKVGKVGMVGKVGKVGKVSRVGKVGKVGEVGKEGRLRLNTRFYSSLTKIKMVKK